MISGLVGCSSFTSTTCSPNQEQGGMVRKLRPLSQIKGLNLRYRESKNLTYNIPKRCSSRISASLPRNLENIEEPISSNKDSLSTYSYATTSDNGNAFAQEIESPIPSWTVIAKKLDAFYRFTRPYTIYGTVVGIMSVSLLPIQTMADFSPAFFVGLLKAIIPTVLMNVYMCGVNQLTDVGIDRINKPTLPLASGEFSIGAATAIISVSALSSFIMGIMLNSPPLLYGILAIFSLATAYSVDLPFLRWKKNAFLTSVCIISVRALVIPVCFFAHVQKYILGRPLVFTKPVLFTVAFMTIIAIIIAIVKDLPDVEGDKAFGLRSPSIIFGREKVFWSCVYTLMATYAGAAALGATSTFLPYKIITVLGHGILSAILWTRAKSVNTSEPSATLSFYLFIWKLLYAEYLLIPFVR